MGIEHPSRPKLNLEGPGTVPLGYNAMVEKRGKSNDITANDIHLICKVFSVQLDLTNAA